MFLLKDGGRGWSKVGFWREGGGMKPAEDNQLLPGKALGASAPSGPED